MKIKKQNFTGILLIKVTHVFQEVLVQKIQLQRKIII